MCILLKEHRYVVQIGDRKHILRVEELVSGEAIWTDKFRLQIPADLNRAAKTLYGAAASEVAKMGADFLPQGRL